MKKTILILWIIFLLICVSILPGISGNIRTINKIVYENVINNRIENIYGLKYYEEGYFIKNHLIDKDTNQGTTSNSEPGELNPIWITIEDLGYIFSMKAYKGNIYAVGYKYYPEEKNRSALIVKFNITNGELLWTKTWEGFHPSNRAYDLEINNDSIYIVGETGPSGDIEFWTDSFLCKYDLDGNRLWSKIINETTLDVIGGVKVFDNYLYLCGTKAGIITMNSWILKYDNKGNKIWSKTYNILGTWFSEFLDFEIYNGYIYAEGQTDSFDKTEQDVYVAKISLDGNLIWNREWGGKGPQLGNRMDVENGYIYVCGYGRDDISYFWGGHDILLKYDLTGNLQWYTTSYCSHSTAIDVIKYNDSIFTVGELWRGWENHYDAVMYKFDDDSNLIWYLTYGSYDYAGGNCIEVYEDFFYICGSIGGDDFLMKYDVNLFADNTKPDKPSKLSGPTSGIPGVDYTYYTNTTDMNGDLISYGFSWGDWNITTVEWFNPGDTVSASYHWSDIGKYNVRVRARDECGFVSDWSDPLVVTMPRDKSISSLPLLRFLERYPLLHILLKRLTCL